jgi:transcription antitermination factor NusG
MAKKGGAIENKWLILRTAGRCTLRLAASLAEDGFEVWTPIEKRVVTVPRASAKRNVRLPLMPGFVFARAVHLLDLLDLALMPQRPRRGVGGRLAAHESFSVFHAQDRIPLISDSALEPLRDAEAVAIPKRKSGQYRSGETVRVLKGNFAGMVGVIEKSDSHTAHVWLSLFGRHMKAQIPAFLLRLDDIGTEQPTLGIAA